jgi:hypothetical protein
MGASESTGADWGSSFDSFDASADTGTAEAADTADADVADAGVEDAGSADATDADPAEAGDGQGQEPEPAAEEAVDAAKPEETEDGVRERVRADGRKEYVLKESRYHTVYGAYKAAQEAEGVLGEPLTREVVESRQNAYVDHQGLIQEFLSGDASSEANVLNFFAQVADAARKNGEVAHDPLANLAARIPDFFASNQSAYTALARPIVQGELTHLKTMARELMARDPNNDALALSIEHIEKALFNEFEPREKFLKAPDPVDLRERQLAEREARLNSQEATERQRQWADFSKQATAEIKSTVIGAVDEALKDVAKAYEAFPHDFKAVKDQLHREFTERTRNDAAWQSQLKALTRKAQIAATPSAREAVKAELLARFKAKAAYLLDPARNESVKGILTSRAAQMKTASDAKHQRLATGAAQRAPGAPGAAVSQSASRLPKAVSEPGGWAAIFRD